MGLFGANYENPGAGIAKDAPKKKGFFRFMEIFGRKFWKLLELNFLYMLFYLPLPLFIIAVHQADCDMDCLPFFFLPLQCALALLWQGIQKFCGILRWKSQCLWCMIF